MISLRYDQVHQYLQQDEAAFVEAILREVRKAHPTWRQTDAMLRDSIQVGIRRARGNGLRSDKHLAEFVLIMCEVAPNFDQQPDIRRMLDDSRFTIEQRWENLFDDAFDSAWAEADQPAFLDMNAWFDEPPKDLSELSLPDLTDWTELLEISKTPR